MSHLCASSVKKHIFYLDEAIHTSTRSKCVSHKVGCVIVKDDDIIATGYNGTPYGYPNCCEVFPQGHNEDHHDWANHHEIHAEQNAICRSAKTGRSINGGIMYCTLKPCMHCTKLIIMSGISAIYYINKYHRNDDTLIDKFLEDNGVICEQIEIPNKG
jgi:dCMP deaminase